MPIPLGSERSDVHANIDRRTLNRKTSLLRIVPTACGQAAGKASSTRPPCRRVAGQVDHVADARRCASIATCESRPRLGAILPLHDVKYRAFHGKRGAWLRVRMMFLSNEALAGGSSRKRTDDLLLAKQALSQLSYGPSRCQGSEASLREHARRCRYLIPESGGPGKI